METMNFKMIELPYVKRELSMFILLPDDIKDNTTGLEQVREHAKTILYYCSVIKKKKKEEQADNSISLSEDMPPCCLTSSTGWISISLIPRKFFHAEHP